MKSPKVVWAVLDKKGWPSLCRRTRMDARMDVGMFDEVFPDDAPHRVAKYVLAEGQR